MPISKKMKGCMTLLSSAANAILSAMKMTGPIRQKMSYAAQRRSQNLVGILIRSARGVNYDRFSIEERIPAAWLTPPDARPDVVMLYCHGGAFMAGGLAYARILSSKLAAVCRMKTLAFAYRLAPEYPYPAAVDDGVDAYTYLLSLGYDARQIVLVGESAGGTMTLTVPLALREKGLPLPGAIVSMSPWTNLACAFPSYADRADVDHCIDPVSLREQASLYAGEESFTNPLVSPCYGDFTGFPPTLIQVGTAEVLYDDAVYIHEKMRRDCVDVTLQVFEDLWHVFQIHEIPEAHDALGKIAAFVDKHVSEEYATP